MKRGIVFVLMAILVAGTLAIFTASTKKSQAATEIDQQHTAGTGSVPIDTYLGRFAQTFMPTKSKLDKVQIELTNVGNNKSANVFIRHNVVGVGWDEGNVTAVYGQTLSDGWNTFDFDDVTVVISDNDTYGIWVVTAENGPQWKYKDGPSEYDRGYAIWQSQDKVDWDYNFKTYGYDPDQPAEPSGDQPGDQGITGTTGTDETLGTATSAIAKPLELTAAYSETNRGVKLAWKASATADIDGYKIFRSENASKGYTKIKETAKDKLDYLDQDIAAGKTYYYQLRAYKSDQQSYSSNTASAKIPDDIVPAKPRNLTVIEVTTNTLSVKWAKSAAADLKGYTISLYKGDEKIRTKDLDKDESLYHFIGLDSGAMYKVELIAKNDKDKTSTPAITYGATEYPEEITSFFNRLTIVGCVLILGLLGYLVYRVIVTRKAKTD